MFGFNSKNNDKLNQLLRESRTEFEFDKEGVKNRLIYSLVHAHLRKDDFKPRRFKLSYTLAYACGVVLVLSSTLVYADTSSPGDKLYFLDQIQERFMLKLPRSADSRAHFNSELVQERIFELNKVPVTSRNRVQRLKAIEATQNKLIETVDEAAEVKRQLKSEGRQKKVERLNEVLIRLERMAEEQQWEIERSREITEDGEDAERFEQNLEAIKKAREKARIQRELNLHDQESLELNLNF